MHSESNIRVWGLVSHPDPPMKALEGSECETICYMYLDRIGQLSSIGLALTLMHTSSTETKKSLAFTYKQQLGFNIIITGYKEP